MKKVSSGGRLMQQIASGDSAISRVSATFDKLNAGGVRQSSLTLIQTALGAGFLTLPYALSLCGVGLGLALMVLGGVLVYFGIEIMLRGAIQMDVDETSTLLMKCVGKWCGPALDGILVFYGNGSIIAYFILCGDFMPGILHDMANMSWIEPIELPKAVLRTRCILATLVVVIPLSIPTSLSALRYATPVALIAVLSTSTMILVNMPSNFGSHVDASGFGPINWVTLDFNFFKAFSIIIFAYNCHMNAVPVASELQRTSSRAIGKITAGLVTLLVAFYGTIGALGYLSFLGNTHQNVLTNFRLSTWALTCRVLLCGSLLAAMPLNLSPTVRSLEGLLKSCCPGRGSAPLQDNLLPDAESPQTKTNASFTLILKAICTAVQVTVALQVSDIASVMGLLGASVGTVLMMGIPLAVLLTGRFEDYSRLKYWSAVMVFSSCMMVTTTAMFVQVLQNMGKL